MLSFDLLLLRTTPIVLPTELTPSDLTTLEGTIGQPIVLMMQQSELMINVPTAKMPTETTSIEGLIDILLPIAKSSLMMIEGSESSVLVKTNL